MSRVHADIKVLSRLLRMMSYDINLIRKDRALSPLAFVVEAEHCDQYSAEWLEETRPAFVVRAEPGLCLSSKE